MTHVLAACPAPLAIGRGWARAVDPMHPVALAFLVAIVVFSTVSMANVTVSRWMDGSPEQVQMLPPPVAGAAEPAVKTRARKRCEAACGVVEAIRQIDPVGVLPASYEFTVRLRDGSTRLSSAATQGKWRAGDAIMLIGGPDSATQQH
jgi:hypothetical protein